MLIIEKNVNEKEISGVSGNLLCQTRIHPHDVHCFLHMVKMATHLIMHLDKNIISE